jgi:formyltetrahydrofolate-dependent phosphoribosylglycinamide formyltransferase
MFERLQQKWKVNGWRLLLILVTFALGGSLCGWLGRQLLGLFQIESNIVRIPLYIILVTILWPFCVILISIPFGQFIFFKSYLKKMGRRMAGRNENTAFRIQNTGERQNTEDEIQHTEAGSQHSEPVKTNTLKQEDTHQSAPSLATSNQPSVSIALFASGAGSNAQKIIDHFRGSKTVNIALIVCNKPGAGVLNIAEKEQIPVLMIEKEVFFRGNGYLDELKSAGIDFIVLAGFLWKVPATLTAAYPNKIVNIHPALLPRYGGKGMYGMHVHEAIIAAGDQESGITIHYVDNVYDNGAIIFQATCAIEPGDTPAILAEKVHQLEHAHYPRIVEQVIGLLQKQR